MANEPILTRMLEGARREGQLVELHRDRLTHDGLMGRVLGHSDSVVVLARLNGSSIGDGVVAVRTPDITRLRTGDRDLCISASIARWEPLPELDVAALPSIVAALTEIERAFGYVGLHVEPVTKTYFMGELEAIDEHHVLLRGYGSTSTMDRFMVALPTDEITFLEAGGQYERQLIEAFRVDEGPRH